MKVPHYGNKWFVLAIILTQGGLFLFSSRLKVAALRDLFVTLAD